MSGDQYQGFEFDPSGLREDVDLDVARRKEILAAEARLGRSTHWELLGIPWNAPPQAAKDAYLAKVKVFHPDRYPGKRLGSFHARLERLFRAVTEARDVLCDEGKRDAYVRVTAPPAEFARLEARKLEDERRSEERRARLVRQNPLVARAGRVQDLVRRGKAALAEGRFGPAANDLLVAQGMDPENAELKALAAEARRKAGGARAKELFENGLEAEVRGSVAAALALFRDALAEDPGHVRAAAHATKAALAMGDVSSAHALAQTAMKAAPSAGLAHEALGLVLDAQGRKKEAKRELEKAVELDPMLEGAKERLKKLRWSFLG